MQKIRSEARIWKNFSLNFVTGPKIDKGDDEIDGLK